MLYSLSTLAEDGFSIGVGIHPTSYKLEPEQLVELLKKYDVKIVRYDYPWSHVELKKGIFTIPNYKLDKFISLASDNNITTIIILGAGNSLYGGGRPQSNAERAAFANYASWVADRFHGKKVIYEIWNEWPHNSKKDNFNPRGDKSASLYVQLVEAASKKIRINHPDSIIIAGGMNPLNKGYDSWTFNIIKLGVLNYINGLSLHPYSYQNQIIAKPSYNIEVLDRLQRNIQNETGIGKDVDFYITEFGYPDYQGGVVFSPDERKDYISNYFSLLSQRNYVKAGLWYDLINDGNDKFVKEFNFGLLDSTYKEKVDMHGFSLAIKKIRQLKMSNLNQVKEEK